MTPLEELLRATLHDPARELPPAPGMISDAVHGVARLRRRRLSLVAAVAAGTAGVIAASVVLADVGARDRGAPAGGQANPTPVVTGIPDAEVVRRISLPLDGVADLAMDTQAVYALGSGTSGDFLAVRVERSSGQVAKTGLLPNQPAAAALGPAGSLWLTTSGSQASSYSLLQLDRRTLAVRRTVKLGADPPQALAVAGSTLWAGSESTLYKLDANDGRVLDRFHLGRPIFGLSVDPSGELLFARTANEAQGALVALDARTGRELARRVVGAAGPKTAAVAGALWVVTGTGADATRVQRFDPQTLLIRDPGDVGNQQNVGTDVWPGGRWLWVANARMTTFRCVDPRSGTVLGVRRLALGTLVADTAAVYAMTGEGFVQLAPSSICRG